MIKVNNEMSVHLCWNACSLAFRIRIALEGGYLAKHCTMVCVFDSVLLSGVMAFKILLCNFLGRVCALCL